MHFGDLEDPHSEVSRLLESRKNHAMIPAAGTKPQIFFLE
jgi:Fe-S-cluster-containing dehydrogenase component